jgi:hypothetical protein
MKKRILSLVLALSMMISLFPVSALAQTPGGGTAALAEENGTTEETAGTITINSSGEPVTDDLAADNDGYWIGAGWKYIEGVDAGHGTLTLMSGTWDFTKQNAVKCDVMILKDAVVSGGTFEGIVWNEADGKISGGTFKKAVSNKGTITGGIFVGVDLENTSVINYDTGKITGGVFENNVTNGDSGDEGISASITGGLFKAKVQNKADSATITGGVFVTKPTGSGTIANGYTLTTRGTSSKFVYAADGKEIDLGQSVYVIPNNTDTLKVACDGVSNWDVADGSGVTNGDGVTLKQDGSFTLNPDKINGTTLMFTVSTTPVTPDPELVLAGGVPDTSEGHAKQKTVDGKTIYYGNGWTYDGETLKLNPTEEKTFDLSCNGSYLKCELEVGEKATVKGWIFLSRPVENHGVIDGPKFHTEGNGYSGYPTLTNYGTVRNCYVDYGYVTNNGTMENVSFVCCKRLTNNAGATIKNAIIRTDDRNGKMSYSNSGKIDEAVFDFSPSGEQKVHVLKASSGETVGATLSGIKAVVFGTEVYIVGEPEVKVKISGSNKETITDVNGKTTYGGLTVGKDSEGFQKFIVQEKDKELVLNQIGAPDPSEVKHTLTLNDAVIVKDDGSTATTGKYKEGVTVKIKPQINDSKKVFSRWSIDPNGFEAIVPNDDTEGTYTLTMPGYNLSVRAESTYRSYPLTVVGGTFENTFGNRVEWSAHVTVKANVPYGKYFAGWEAKETGTDTAVTLRDWSGKVIDLMDENLTTLRFPMPDKAVTLTAVYKDCEKKLVMKADGTPDLTHVYKENGRRYVGDGWWYFSVEDGSEVNALYLSPDALTEYDFAHTDPIGKTGTLEAVNCIIVEYNTNATIVGGTFAEEVDNRGTIWNGIFKGKVYNGDVPYSATIKNGTFMGEVINSNNSTITGGIFAGGVKRSETDAISGGIFNEGTALQEINGAHKIVLEGAQILSINGVSRANGWSNVYAFAETELTVEASQSIYNVNGETTGATGLQTSTIKFTMSDEDAVLNKGVTPDPETKPKPNPTPNPDAQPKTYTVTVKGGKINNETEVKAEKGTELTVDVDETEVPEGMTFDVWSIRFPEGVKDTLTGDTSVKLHDPHMSFTMPEADITIEAQYRSSELPGEDDGPSTLGTMATVAVGGAAAGILVWQGVSLGVDSYLQLNLPKGVAVPANRRELVVLLWETAGKPEAALPSLYSDVPAEEIELQKATRWAIDNGLVKPADDSDASRFDPDRYVTKYDVFGAWLKLKKLMK